MKNTKQGNSLICCVDSYVYFTYGKIYKITEQNHAYIIFYNDKNQRERVYKENGVMKNFTTLEELRKRKIKKLFK